MKIVYTPEPGYTGPVGNVQFVDGVAKVDDDAQELTYMRSAGYRVDDEQEAVDAASNEDEAAELEQLNPQAGTPIDPDEQQLPRRSASAADWRVFAVEHGGMTQDEADSLTRDDLVAHFYKESGQ